MFEMNHIHPNTDLLSCSTACPMCKTNHMQLNIDLLSCSTACPMCKTKLIHHWTTRIPAHCRVQSHLCWYMCPIWADHLFYLYYICLSTSFPMSIVSSNLCFPCKLASESCCNYCPYWNYAFFSTLSRLCCLSAQKRWNIVAHSLIQVRSKSSFANNILFCKKKDSYSPRNAMAHINTYRAYLI